MLTILVPLVGTLGAGCSSPGESCLCNPPDLVLRIPAARIAAVSAVRLGGTACNGVSPACAESAASGCARYVFRANRAGKCQVEVDFTSGGTRFSAEVPIVEAKGCCSGFYAEPASAADIEAPG